MDELAFILEKIKQTAKEHAFELTDFAPRIAAAKLRFYGKDNWQKCPCVHDDRHFCISPACKNDILSKGVCHCNLYKKTK